MQVRSTWETGLLEKGVSFCLRLKRNHCIETEHLVWQRLDELGIVPGTSLYFQGKRVRKTRPATGFDVASSVEKKLWSMAG
ncbi:hypothetical protein QUA86_34795 [Microcoleus sp. F6_B6]